jgi:tripartite-type tricarboxylate transporter receptor subunit TctC
VRKLNADTVAVLREPAIISALEKTGVSVVGSTPAELAKLLKDEIDLWGPVIKAAGIKPEE